MLGTSHSHGVIMLDFYIEILTNVSLSIIPIIPYILVIWFGIDIFSSLFFGRGK